MRYQILLARILWSLVCFQLTAPRGVQAEERVLPSWNPGAARESILRFTDEVTKPASSNFVPEEERVAVFDNDGTLWTEQPVYFQWLFAIHRLKSLAPKHPEWKTLEPFKTVLEGDERSMLKIGRFGMLTIVSTVSTGMTTEEYEGMVLEWVRNGRHPRFDRPFTDLVYLPMLELLQHLRSHGFKTYIISGGEQDFMRPWATRAYGIPADQIQGTTVELKFTATNDTPRLLRLPRIAAIDDGPGKPVGIQRRIGQRPIAAFGNSDGDLEMLQWTTLGSKRRTLGLIVHHTDAEREWAYDRDSPIGRLDKALDAAKAHRWTIVDMKRDWRTIFPFEKGTALEPNDANRSSLPKSARPEPASPPVATR